MKKAIYWGSTGLLCLAMLGAGFSDLSHAAPIMDAMDQLGYPDYLANILGFWKLLSVPALLSPGFPLLKEWAYAGLFFDLSGAFISHRAAGQPLSAAVPAIVLLILVLVSWYTRPSERKLSSAD